MGWSLDDHTEFFTMEDLVKVFSLDRLNPSPAAINFAKLDHFNGLHIRSLSVADLAARLKPFFEKAGYQPSDEMMLKIAPLIQERMSTLDEGPELAGFLFHEDVSPVPGELVAKGLTAAESAVAARRSLGVLEGAAEWTPEVMEPPMRALVEELGWSAGQVFGILRVAMTGLRVSPPLFESMEVIGREKCLERLRAAIAVLEKME